MSASFSRSIRALQSETAVHSIWRIFIVTVLLALWFSWFFLAEIPLYETSETAVFQSPTRVLATFSPEALIYIQPEQPAQLQLDDFPISEYGTIPAVVARVDPVVREGAIQVILNIVLPQDNPNPIPLQRELSGSAEIKVGARSPAMLLWQAVGQKISPFNHQ